MLHVCGRVPIFTDVPVVDGTNIIQVLQDAYSDFAANADRSDFLIRYEGGQQPLQRVKTYRSDINIIAIDNVANEVTNFKKSFGWGNPITLVQRGEQDGGSKTESEAIIALNSCFDAEDIKGKTQELGRYVEICGVAYTYIDINDDWEEGESFFKYIVLDPRFSFVIKSSYYADRRDMVDVTFRVDRMGNKYMTCFTKDKRFEVVNFIKIVNGDKVEDADEWFHADRSGEENPLHMLPFTEWIRDYDRSGCFERQIPDMDALNILESDFANDVDQNTQAIWHCNDVDFPVDEDGETQTPTTNDWMQTYTSPDGKTPFVTPLSISYDYTGMLENITTKRALILQKCGVPNRGDATNSTGVAMDGATGWSHAEIEAAMQDQIRDGCKMNEVKIALKAIKVSPHTPADSPLLDLKYSDVMPNIKRQKNYELNTKINALATGLSHGVSPKHMLRIINLFDDPQQVYEDSKELLDRYFDSVFSEKNNEPEGGTDEPAPNADRIMQDESDQIDNSPNIDGTVIKESTDGDETV